MTIQRVAPLTAHPASAYRRLGSPLADQVGRFADFPEVGSEFAGFRLTSLLGVGGFARVYLAQQGELADRPVVLKITRDPSSEPQTLARLQHTHIVPIYSVHRVGALTAVVMPYFGPTTLADVVDGVRASKELPRSGQQLLATLTHKQRSVAGPDTPAPAARPDAPRPGVNPELLQQLAALPYTDAVLLLAVNVAGGLAHAHERGIIHRDLKPANVLLTDEGRPMILDFNLAQPALASIGAGGGGTVAYMAPEQLDAFLHRRPLVSDRRSDLYALGLVLWELLAGQPPFPWPGDDPADGELQELLDRRRQGPPPLTPFNGSVTPATEAIIACCLAPDPAYRYPTALALREDLERQIAHQPLKHLPEPSMGERVAKWQRRNPRTAPALAVMLMLTLIAGGLAIRLQDTAGLATARQTRDSVLAAKRLLAPGLPTSSFDAVSSRRALAESRATLAGLGLPDDANWSEGPAVRRLPPAEHAALRRELAEWLFLMARAEAGPTGRARTPAEATAAARWSQRAVECWGPEVPALVRRQADDLALIAAGKPPSPTSLPEPANGYEAYLQAADLMMDGRPNEASPLAHQAADERPDLFAARMVSGYCHLMAGHNDLATVDFDACLELDPNHSAAHFNRGIARMRVGQWAGALNDFNVVLTQKPNDADALTNRATARQQLKDLPGAVADLTRALAIPGASTVRLLLLRANSRWQLGDRTGAVTDRQNALATTPTDEAGWIARGLAQRNPRDGLADFEAALRINPVSYAALQNRASYLSEQLDQPAEAIATLDLLLKLYPEQLASRAGRAVLYARAGRAAEALTDADTVERQDDQPATLYQLAGVYAQLTRQDETQRPEAYRRLLTALKQGYGWNLLAQDHDLDPLRTDPEFREIERSAALWNRPKTD